MIKVNVKVDIQRALDKLHLTKAEAKRAIPRALNKVAASARAQAAREIRDAGYGLKVGDIKRAISVRKATPAELTAVVRATGRPIPLIKYGARQTRAGVTVRVKNGRKLIKGAFIAVMPSGHEGVFTRRGPGHKRRVKGGKVVFSGLPIDELFGPSIPSAFANKVVTEALVSQMKQRFPIVLQQELSFVLLKR